MRYNDLVVRMLLVWFMSWADSRAVQTGTSQGARAGKRLGSARRAVKLGQDV